MRLILTSLAAATLLLAASCTSSESTPTGGTDGLKIAYVRADSLTQLYDYHRELTEKFELEAKKVEADLVRAQQNLQTEYSILEKAAPSLNPVQLQRAQADFQRIQMSYSQMEQQRTGELAEKEAGLNTQIKDQMDVALKQLAKEKGYDLVLVYETNVLYGSDKLDVTQELADVLNKMDRPEPKKSAPKK